MIRMQRKNDKTTFPPYSPIFIQIPKIEPCFSFGGGRGEPERERDTGGISGSEFNLIEQPVLCPTIIQMNISLALP